MPVCNWSLPRHCAPPAFPHLFLLSPCSPSLSPAASTPHSFWCRTKSPALKATPRPRHQGPLPSFRSSWRHRTRGEVWLVTCVRRQSRAWGPGPESGPLLLFLSPELYFT